MVEETFEDNANEDLDMYAIAADELAEGDLDVEEEMQKLAMEYFLIEEEEKEDEIDEEEIRFSERAAELRQIAKCFAPSQLSGDYRCPNAGYYGGFTCTDAALMKRLRSALTEIVKMVGKKLFSGSIDLTKISFPIKCMCPVSTLELMPTLQTTMVVYLNKAASISDPLERMKLVMAHNLSFFYKEKIFEKPLNPILGETFQARGQDGAYLFMEQTSHHPPISHFYIDGPDGNYRLTGWSQHIIQMGLQSCNL